nr:immunoglobulin light chain junction region [Macaca mulatta]
DYYCSSYVGINTLF